MATLIKTDGSETQVSPHNNSHFTLEELQGIVGGYIQILDLPSGMMMVLDEEGKLKDKPRNNRATPMAAAAGTMRDDFVVGDVLIINKSEMD